MWNNSLWWICSRKWVPVRGSAWESDGSPEGQSLKSTHTYDSSVESVNSAFWGDWQARAVLWHSRVTMSHRVIKPTSLCVFFKEIIGGGLYILTTNSYSPSNWCCSAISLFPSFKKFWNWYQGVKFIYMAFKLWVAFVVVITYDLCSGVCTWVQAPI